MRVSELFGGRRVLAEATDYMAMFAGILRDQPEEAENIRQKWEDLKSCVERFVTASEMGHYSEATKKK